MTAALVAGAAPGALYGAAAGLLVTRTAARMAVDAGRPWRAACEQGHPLQRGVRGWLGPTDCPRCAGVRRPPYARAACGAAAGAALTTATGLRPELAAWLLALPLGLLLAAVDWRVRRLPDVLTLPLAAGLAALLGGAAALPSAGGDWVRALLGGAAFAGVLLVAFLVRPELLGFGDVKLALAVGVALGWYGWWPLAAGFLLAHLLLLAGGGLLALRRRATPGAAPGSDVPFGPFLLAAAAVGVVLGALGTPG